MEEGNKFDKSFTISSTLKHESENPGLAWSVLMHSVQLFREMEHFRI
jgi:hypothetical protein